MGSPALKLLRGAALALRWRAAAEVWRRTAPVLAGVAIVALLDEGAVLPAVPRGVIGGILALPAFLGLLWAARAPKALMVRRLAGTLSGAPEAFLSVGLAVEGRYPPVVTARAERVAAEALARGALRSRVAWTVGNAVPLGLMAVAGMLLLALPEATREVGAVAKDRGSARALEPVMLPAAPLPRDLPEELRAKAAQAAALQEAAAAGDEDQRAAERAAELRQEIAETLRVDAQAAEAVARAIAPEAEGPGSAAETLEKTAQRLREDASAAGELQAQVQSAGATAGSRELSEALQGLGTGAANAAALARVLERLAAAARRYEQFARAEIAVRGRGAADVGMGAEGLPEAVASGDTGAGEMRVAPTPDAELRGRAEAGRTPRERAILARYFGLGR